MADRLLVQGAAALGKSMMPIGIGKAFAEGFEKTYGEILKRKEQADNLTKQYIAKIPNVDAIAKIPEWMKADVNNYLVSEKQKYADTAKKLSTMSSSDPAYMDTVNELQTIQNNFVNLNNQLNQFQEDTKEYIADVDNGNVSEGFKQGKFRDYNNTTSVFTGNAPLKIKDGQLIFTVSGQDLNYSAGEVGDYFNPDFKVQNEIDKLALLIEADAGKGISFNSKQDFYARRIQNALQQGGKERLLSLVYDDDPRFTTAQGLQTPQILSAIRNEDYNTARALISDELLKGMQTTHSQFLSEYNKKQQIKGVPTKLSEEQEARLRATRAYNLIAQDPVAYAKTKLRGAFKGSQGNSKITLQVGDEDKTYDLTKPLQFQEFMDVARENSQLFATGSEGAELTRGIFYDIVKEQSKKISEIQAGREKEQQAIIAKAVSTAIPGVNPINTADLPIF